jgi:hypothetical protein
MPRLVLDGLKNERLFDERMPPSLTGPNAEHDAAILDTGPWLELAIDG